MEKIEERAQELRKLDVSRETALEILKREYPKYHEHYYEDLTSELESTGKSETISASQTTKEQPQEVKVIGFDMPFSDMVIFMVKWAIAAIPAFIILFIIGSIISLILVSLGITISQF